MVTFTTSPELIAYDNAISTMENHVQSMLAQEKDEWVWFCEHPPLYTGGTSAKDSDLLQPKFPVFQTGRGGEYTYHGPGQRIAYVMLDLKKRKAQDVKSYVCTLEQWLINTLKHFDVDGQRRQGRVGIWVIDKQGKECKIAAMGIRIKRWVTFHGIALNINPDLSHYNGIVPCGIKDYGVTSLAALGIDVSQKDVDHILTQEFMALFAQN